MISKLNQNQPKEILTAEEAMTLLSIKRSTFDRMRKEGFIKVYKIRRKLYCKYSEILETLDNSLLQADEERA